MKRIIIITIISIIVSSVTSCISKGNKSNLKVSDENTYNKEVSIDDFCEDAIIKFVDRSNKCLCIIGTLGEEISESKKVISEFKIVNCKTGNVLIDQSDDAVTKNLVTINSDSMILADIHYVLKGNDWNYELVPFYEKSIRFKDNEPTISNSKFVFNPPNLSKLQLDSINNLCLVLRKIILKDAKVIYPYDEKSIYKLFMGAINNHIESSRILDSLDVLFILDGAIAETRAEICFPLPGSAKNEL